MSEAPALSSAAPRHIKPAQFLILGFLGMIAVGTLLLMLPIATKAVETLGFIDALFMATSSICVTGLATINVGAVLSSFGQWVLLLLIQCGGLGFMTMTSLLFIMVGKRFSLRERMVIQEAYSLESIQGVVKLVRYAVVVTFTAEAAGALLLLARFIPQFGVAQGVFYAVFLSVSAFCNAGLDPLGGDSLVAYSQDPYLCIVVMLLITVGGLGFPVIMDLIHRRRFSRLMIHSRVVLLVSAFLFLTGAAGICLTEWNNPGTLGAPGNSVGDKLLMACFQSVTLRTAGFITFPQQHLSPAGSLLSMACMFVGASPSSWSYWPCGVSSAAAMSTMPFTGVWAVSLCARPCPSLFSCLLLSSPARCSFR